MSLATLSNSLTADELLRLQTFMPLLNTKFEVVRGSEWVTLELAEVKDYAETNKKAGLENFSLIFAAAPDKPLQQGLHDFEHPALGRFELFIVPVMCPQPDTRWYQAIIHRDGTL